MPTEPVVRQYPERESNPQTPGFKPSRSAGWRIWAKVVLGGLEPSHESLRKQGVGPRGDAESDAESGSFGSERDAIAQWLEACPVALDDRTKGGILAIVRGGMVTR